MNAGIAIVGLACCYPGANTPDELWENVLAQRKAFRKIPAERLRMEDYFSDDRSTADATYSQHAALIEGYVFDRIHFRVSGESFRATDLAHWLALDVASRALEDAGWPQAAGIPKESTRVIIGNTLTGEFSRASVLRLRWPYVRRALESVLTERKLEIPELQELLEALEDKFKGPFAPVGEDTLAGGLSNTIAGRISNFFDLGGGCFSLDGACASSLLAVAEACSALSSGEIDVALAGGVDLSVDPFELVGFAKVGALASGAMRVFDQHPTGFLPGEGCGFVVLMRYADALSLRANIRAVIRGWGISSDGAGGITRPDVEGQLLAVMRAYQRAGFGMDSVSFFEGHGTGTAVGDATELEVLSRARASAMMVRPGNFQAVVGSVKAIIGHTKAAAGVGGLIKTIKALQTRILPPTTGCVNPHLWLKQKDAPLRQIPVAEPWPADQPLRAGVSAMGFGGINCHVVLENPEHGLVRELTKYESELVHSHQGVELFCFAAPDVASLRGQIRQISAYVARLSLSELTDLAATLAEKCIPSAWRAAVVAASPEELQERLQKIDAALASGSQIFDAEAGIFAATVSASPHITFLFPGQGSPVYMDGGVLPLRYPGFRYLFEKSVTAHGSQEEPETQARPVATDIAQPTIVRTEIAGLKLLQQAGIEARSAIGHSLGELVALHWAEVFDEAALLRIVATRGKSMAGHGLSVKQPAEGAMAMIAADAEAVIGLLQAEPVVVAGINSPLQTIISGEVQAVHRVVERAKEMLLRATLLSVRHAFHSPLMASAEAALGEQLAQEQIQAPAKKIYSTVSGTVISTKETIAEMLVTQLTAPVLFYSAMQKTIRETDLFIEVGPGDVLTEISRSFVKIPVIATDFGGGSLKGFLLAAAAAFTMGAPVKMRELFAGRFRRKFSLDWSPTFFANPCEMLPAFERKVTQTSKKLPPPSSSAHENGNADVLTELIQLVARRCELPPEAISGTSRLRDDLHLNSIAVSQIVVEVAKKIGVQAPPHPTAYSNVSLMEAAEALKAIQAVQKNGCRSQLSASNTLSGVEPWVRAFASVLVEEPLGQDKPLNASGEWVVLAPDAHERAALLQQELREEKTGAGVVVWLPPEPDKSNLSLLLEATRLAKSRRSSLIVVQHGWGASAFCRSLHQEAPHIPIAVINVSPQLKSVSGLVLREIAGLSGFVEVHYDDRGMRLLEKLVALPLARRSVPLALSKSDVLLVTGGGKGIGSECALHLARESRCKVILVGRSKPESDPPLAKNLERFAANGIVFQYVSLDITDGSQVGAAIQRLQAEMGSITGVLHAAGTNSPRTLEELDEAQFEKALAPKLHGAQNLLSSLRMEQLRFFIAFGSIIARTGLHGEAHYGLANEWLAAFVKKVQTQQPHCRCMVLEWSVWSGAGMGVNLGTIESLRAQGVMPISVEAGTKMIEDLLQAPPEETRLVISSRFSQSQMLLKESELPLLRFLETPRIYYPGVELVVDSDISVSSDLYLVDHVLGKEHLFPAVVAMEAMAQVANVLLNIPGTLVFEDLEFAQAISVPQRGKIKLRVAALVTTENVKLVVRTDATGFAVDHFRATCRKANGEVARNSTAVTARPDPVPLDCERDLYRQLLFHAGRFRCVRAYYRLNAKECIAELKRRSNDNWFARHLPGQWLLGRPDIRDAAIHAIQACIPHARVIPVEVQKLVIANTELPDCCYVHAQEVSHHGAILTYDMKIVDANGESLEEWTGLKLKIVEAIKPDSWPAATLGPYLQRKMAELAPSVPMTVALDQTGCEAAPDYRSEIYHRPYGRPELQGKKCASLSHSDNLTMLVAGDQLLACDLEAVASVNCSWKELLGEQHYALAKLISDHSTEDFDVAATRVWSALECLKKAEIGDDAPLSMLPLNEEHWVLMRSGTNLLATFSAKVTGRAAPLVSAILVNDQSTQRTGELISF